MVAGVHRVEHANSTIAARLPTQARVESSHVACIPLTVQGMPPRIAQSREGNLQKR